MKYTDQKEVKRKYKQTLLATVVTMTLGVSTLGSTAFAAEVVASGQTTPSSEEIGQGATVYSNYSVLENSLKDIKTSLKVSIIKDPNSNKQRAVISTDGSRIGANKTLNSGWNDNQAAIKWASSYDVQMELPNPEQKATFHEISPKDEIREKTVTNSVGYKIGGDIQTSPAGSVTGEFSWSTNVSYNQADYITRLKKSNAHTVQWSIPFMNAMNGNYGPYDRESSDSIYGNQLFMKSRTKNNAIDNFIPTEQMPALSAEGFSPGVIAVVEVPKDSEELTDLTVTYTRHSDQYSLSWMNITSYFSNWVGFNTKNVSRADSSQKYTIDWKNHKLIEKGNSEILDGTYKIASKLEPNKVLDMSMGADRNATLWTYHSGVNQQWELKYVADKQAYQIENQHWQHNILAWNKYNGSQQVFATENKQKDEHYWTLEDAGDGYFLIKNLSDPNMVLDVSNSNTTDGTQLQVYKKNGSNAQKFKLGTLN
ncbi:beta-channel forming cytolysin [Bacillus cereus]|uniref:beta-channel forming cytolysin n=1 Tax=Bacillus cereus TaxID=1396 RepID=UPI00398173BE